MRDHLSALRKAIDYELPSAAELRHRIHSAPDISGEEGPTRDLVLASLPSGCEVTHTAGTGAIVRVGGGGPAVAVRAELDALRVQETTDVPWISARDGSMHACGHDVHMAALVALANAVDRVGGPVPLLAVLQPREEAYPSGARDIVTEGLLRGEQCVAIIGAHVQPLLDPLEVACTPGIVNASSDEFVIRIGGVGGHAAYPHLAVDPVLTLSHVVVALQGIVSRRVDPMATVVLSVTMFQAGSAPNVTPGEAVARGTVRAMDERSRERVLSQMVECVDLISRAHGCRGETKFMRGEPTLDNDLVLADSTSVFLGELGLKPNTTLRSAGSDDFAYFSEVMPSLMMFVGTHGGSELLHTPTFLPDDSRIRDVAYAMLAGYLAAATTIDPVVEDGGVDVVHADA